MTIKQVVGAVALTGAVALGVSACAQFAPTRDVGSITAAVREAIIEQNSGNVKLNCSFDSAHRIGGASAKWSNSSGDSGYVCVGGISTSGNLYADLGTSSSSNNVPPFYPIAYSNIINGIPQTTTYGAAVVSSNNTVLVQIDNPGNDVQTISTVRVPGLDTNPFVNPFAVAKRK